jgi:uncharacterized protein YjiS (DUF1127 family)
MTALQDLRQTISQFFDDRRKRRRLQLELAQLAAMGSLDAVLADVGLVRSQIEPLIAGCAGSRELLDQMLARLGIDAARLPVEDLRNMTWTCTTCPDKRKCGEWLADIAETDFHAFCPNAEQLDHALAAAAPAGKQHRAPSAADALNDGAYHPTADDLRRMRGEASQREVRAMLDSAHLI